LIVFKVNEHENICIAGLQGATFTISIARTSYYNDRSISIFCSVLQNTSLRTSQDPGLSSNMPLLRLHYFKQKCSCVICFQPIFISSFVTSNFTSRNFISRLLDPGSLNYINLISCTSLQSLVKLFNKYRIKLIYINLKISPNIIHFIYLLCWLVFQRS
jgi:hypothetical protein